jgi:hypothetical protein
VTTDDFEITSAEDADKAMTELARLDVSIAAEGADFNEAVVDLQAQGADTVRPLVVKKIGLVEALTAWAQAIYPTLKKKKLAFSCGEISMKKGAEVIEWLPGQNEDTCIEVLRRRPTLSHLVKTQEITSVDLNDLKKVDPKLHEDLGFRVVEQEPSVTITTSATDYEKVAKAELKKAASR